LIASFDRGSVAAEVAPRRIADATRAIGEERSAPPM
jgi:hypothetical protein